MPLTFPSMYEALAERLLKRSVFAEEATEQKVTESKVTIAQRR